MSLIAVKSTLLDSFAQMLYVSKSLIEGGWFTISSIGSVT